VNRDKCITSARVAFAAALFAFGTSFATGAAAQSPLGAQGMPSPALGVPQAPIGHRQPRPSDLPPGVQQEEKGMSADAAHVAPRAERVARASVAGVPNYNIEAACRALAAVPEALTDEPNATQHCVDAENQARDQLAKEWSQFKAADRSMCVGVSSQGQVDPVYTELISCLEMAADNGSGASRSSTLGATYNLAPSVNPPEKVHASRVIGGLQNGK
jgi:hypothetical protein